MHFQRIQLCVITSFNMFSYIYGIVVKDLILSFYISGVMACITVRRLLSVAAAACVWFAVYPSLVGFTIKVP